MRKVLVAALALVLSAGLCACGSNTSGESSNAKNTQRSQGATESNNAYVAFNTDITIEKQTIYDENDIVITADSIKYEDNEAKISITIKNNSKKPLDIDTDDERTVVNSFTLSGLTGSYDSKIGAIESGETYTGDYTIDLDYLQLIGITEISDIQLNFKITDENFESSYTGATEIKTDAFDSAEKNTDNYLTAIQNKTLQGKVGYEVKKVVEKNYYDSNGITIDNMTEFTVGGEYGIFMEVTNTNDKDATLGIGNIKADDDTLYSGTGEEIYVVANTHGFIFLHLDSLIEYGKEYGEDKNLRGFDKLAFDVEQKDKNGNTTSLGTVEIENLNFNVSEEENEDLSD